jgi:hypothetical protein
LVQNSSSLDEAASSDRSFKALEETTPFFSIYIVEVSSPKPDRPPFYAFPQESVVRRVASSSHCLSVVCRESRKVLLEGMDSDIVRFWSLLWTTISFLDRIYWKTYSSSLIYQDYPTNQSAPQYNYSNLILEKPHFLPFFFSFFFRWDIFSLIASS